MSVKSNPTVCPQNPLAAYDPVTMERSNNRWGKVWTVAAVVSAVAFIAIASISFAYVSLFYESQLLVTAILIFAIGMPSSFRAFQYMWDKSSSYAEESRIDHKMVVKMNSWSDEETQQKVVALGVNPQSTQGSLKGLLARYEYCQERKAQILEEATCLSKSKVEISLKDRVHHINPKDFAVEKVDFSNKTQKEIFETLQRMRAARAVLLENAATYQLKSAYALKVMEDPYENASESQYFNRIPTRFIYRVIASRSGDSSSDLMIKTPKGNYTAGQVLDTSTYTLARSIFKMKGNGYLF